MNADATGRLICWRVPTLRQILKGALDDLREYLNEKADLHVDRKMNVDTVYSAVTVDTGASADDPLRQDVDDVSENDDEYIYSIHSLSFVRG